MADLKKNDWSYSGDLVDGERSGFGKCVWQNGKTYEGEWVKDQQCGNGFQTGPQGTFDGFFIDGSYIGKLTIASIDGTFRKPKNLEEAFTKTVRIVEPNGDIYTGTWFGGQKNGYGSLEIRKSQQFQKGFFLKNHFVGQVYKLDKNLKHRKVPFQNGDFSGVVWIDYEHGGTYHGDWKNGKREGSGTMVYLDKSEYIGTWIDDKMCGSGCKYIFDLGTYEGDFKNGHFEGHGQIEYQDKVVFKGNFKNGVRDGYGSLKYPDGIKCKGYWENGRRLGEFTYTFANKSVFTGEFKNDHLVGKATFTSSFGFPIYVSFDNNRFKPSLYSGEISCFELDVQKQILDTQRTSALMNQSKDNSYSKTLVELYLALIKEIMFRVTQTELTYIIPEFLKPRDIIPPKYSIEYSLHWTEIIDPLDDDKYHTGSGQPIDNWKVWD